MNALSVADKSVEDQDGWWVESSPDGSTAKITDAMLFAWSERMFAGGSEAAVVLGGWAVIDELTVGDCVLMKAAVQRLYKERAREICRSPERPDLRLSQEEAQGHLAGNLVIGEVLASEARKVGKDIDNVIAKEEAAKNKAAKEAKELRRSAKKAAADEAAGAQAVAAVDAAVDNARSERLRTPAVLKNLPPRRSIIVTTAPKPIRPPMPPPNPVKTAEQALAVAEDAKVRAEGLHRAAQRKLARLLPPTFGGDKLTSRSISYFIGNPDRDSPAELQRRDELFDKMVAAEAEVRDTEFALSQAARDVKNAQWELDEARGDGDFDKLMARFRASAVTPPAEPPQDHWRAELDHEVRAERAEVEARFAALRLERDREIAEIDEKIRELDRQATRERLQRDAEHVWAGRAKENAAPKVFRLVGVSAESVRAVADQVSSEVTSVEERVSLNMWANASLHKVCVKPLGGRCV